MYPIKAGNISEGDDSIMSEIYYFNLMVSYLYSFHPLSALMRLASTSAAVLYNNLDSWHHWQKDIGVKGSNRRGRLF